MPVKKPTPKVRPISAAKKAAASKKIATEKLAAENQAEMALFEAELEAAQKDLQRAAANPVIGTIKKVG